MEERKLVDVEEVKDVLGDTINSEGDYRHALRLLNGLNSVTEQDIVKPVLDKIRERVEKLQKACDKDDLNLSAQYSAFGMVLDIIDEESEGEK